MADTTLKVSQLKPQECYNLPTANIAPRPIALDSTLNELGLVNAAP